MEALAGTYDPVEKLTESEVNARRRAAAARARAFARFLERHGHWSG